jgi:hypothetical protein
MRRLLALALSLTLAALPSLAHAQQCRSIPECLSMLGPGHVDWRVAAVAGAIATPVVVAGAVVTAAAMREQPAEPRGVVRDPNQPRPTLSLVPPADPKFPHNPPPRPQETPPPPPAAFRFNDVAANVAIAVGGAAILAGIIAGIVKK